MAAPHCTCDATMFPSLGPCPVHGSKWNRDELERLRKAAGPRRCMVPPEGWLCTREHGHDGPCAAHPVHINAEADLNPAEWMLLADLMHRAFAKVQSDASERGS